MAKTLANELRALAAEFKADRDYRTSDRREAFRSQLVDVMYRAAWWVEEAARLSELPLPPDELGGLGFDGRIRNALRNCRIVTVSQVAAMKDHQLLRIPNLGRVSLERLRSVIPYVEQGRPRVRVPAGRSIN